VQLRDEQQRLRLPPIRWDRNAAPAPSRAASLPDHASALGAQLRARARDRDGLRRPRPGTSTRARPSRLAPGGATAQIDATSRRRHGHVQRGADHAGQQRPLA
jgi:hypothetical protein